MFLHNAQVTQVGNQILDFTVILLMLLLFYQGLLAEPSASLHRAEATAVVYAAGLPCVQRCQPLLELLELGFERGDIAMLAHEIISRGGSLEFRRKPAGR